MSTTVPSLVHDQDPGRSSRPAFGRSVSWRGGFLRVLGAAHVLVGLTDLSRVLGNLSMQVGYLGGPLGLLGVLTLQLNQFLNSLAVASLADPIEFHGRSQWIMRTAQVSQDFFVAMVAAHIALGLLNIALGQGLWRRRPWARHLEIPLVGLTGVVAAAHGVLLVWAGGEWRWFGLAVLLLSLPVTVPVLWILLSPRTAALFGESPQDVPAARHRRAWWMLSLQWLAGLLALILAAAILLLLNLGPMVEIAWVAIYVTEGRPF